MTTSYIDRIPGRRRASVSILIPTSQRDRGRWITRRLRMFPRDHVETDELARREAHLWTHRQRPAELKRAIRKSLGFLALGRKAAS